MSHPFSFSFTGDDIEPEATLPEDEPPPVSFPPETGSLLRRANPAFPVAGGPLLSPTVHDLDDFLETLPDKISYSSLDISLDDGSRITIPRRELWDIRLQLMAENDDIGLGKDDVKTGIYEGGFKSWESSVDLVKELAKATEIKVGGEVQRVLELGCGTALPSLALLQWHVQSTTPVSELSMVFADYNSSVLRLVTLPNILLSLARFDRGSSWDGEGDLYIDTELLEKFKKILIQWKISLNFLSGAWGHEFVRKVLSAPNTPESSLLVLAAETIYSPAALDSFTETLMQILKQEQHSHKVALVAAKKVYFGVGGSIEDFCTAVEDRSGLVKQVREESDGVRRAVIEVQVSSNI